MGARRQDYAAVAPPHSYIHVDDFAHPRDLADYLRRLDADDALYNSYFRWKAGWRLRPDNYWCRLCTMLHAAEQQRYVTWYANYEDCWNGACHAYWADNGLWQTWTAPAGADGTDSILSS